MSVMIELEDNLTATSPPAKRLKRDGQEPNDKGEAAIIADRIVQQSFHENQEQCEVLLCDVFTEDVCKQSGASVSIKEVDGGLLHDPRVEKFTLRCGGVEGPLAFSRNSGWREVLSDWERRSFVAHRPNAFSAEQLQTWFQLCDNSLPWEQPSPVIPRGACWLVLEGCKCSYDYAAVSFAPAVMPDWFLKLTQVVCNACGITDPPNSCNANRYSSGMESVGWHADSEVLFDATNRDALILSLSLGAPRRFELRPNQVGGGGACAHVILSDGDLCAMEGLCQRHYQHCVPKDFAEANTRINLTWRWLVSHSSNICPLAESGSLGEKLRELSKAKLQLKWKQLKREMAQQLPSASHPHEGSPPSSSSVVDQNVSRQEKMRLLQEQLGNAKERLAELKRKRGNTNGG